MKVYVRGGRHRCCDCGKSLKNAATRCFGCYRARLDEIAQARGIDPIKLEAQREHMRKYMRNLRALDPQQWSERQRLMKLKALRKRPITRQLCEFRECAYLGFDHAHCDCGLVVAPTEQVCPMCIAEQPRLEFKIWPKEVAA